MLFMQKSTPCGRFTVSITSNVPEASRGAVMDTWLPDISDDDIGVLLEALEAWETKDFAGEMMGDIFGAILCGKDPTAKAEMENSRRGEKVKREREKVLRKERSIILRAKLLTIRERRRVDLAIDGIHRIAEDRR